MSVSKLRLASLFLFLNLNEETSGFHQVSLALKELNWKFAYLQGFNRRTSLTKPVLKELNETSFRFQSNVDCTGLDNNVVFMKQISSVKLAAQCVQQSTKPWNVLIIYSENGLNPYSLDLQKSAGFYLMGIRNGSWTMDRVLIVKHDNVIQKVKIPMHQQGANVSLGGIQLKSSGIDDGQNFDHANAREIQGILARKLNFTINYQHQDPNLSWGIVPLNGNWSDPTSFQGLYGMLVNQDLDILTNFFAITAERHLTSDYLLALTYGEVMLFTNLSLIPTDIDATFFTRPLAGNAWLALFSVFLMTMLINHVVDKVGSSVTLIGMEAIPFSAWICFTIVFAFYSGAQTMFFADPVRLPFSQVDGVLQHYPTWKLVTIQGYDIYIRSIAATGKDLFQDYIDRVDSPSGSRYKAKDFEEAVQIVSTEPGTVLSAYRTFFEEYLQIHYGTKKKYHTFGRSIAFSGAFFVKKNSPLKRLLNPALLEMRATGLVDNVFESKLDPRTSSKLEGASESSGKIVPLTFLQTIALFMFYIFAIATSIVVLLCERYRFSKA